MPPGHLLRSDRWAGLRPGDAVAVAGTRVRGASWSFLAHVVNTDTGEEWVEVVGGRAGDRNIRSFPPGRIHPPGAGPPLSDAPRLPFG